MHSELKRMLHANLPDPGKVVSVRRSNVARHDRAKIRATALAVHARREFFVAAKKENQKSTVDLFRIAAPRKRS
jgi:hypothetical protein